MSAMGMRWIDPALLTLWQLDRLVHIQASFLCLFTCCEAGLLCAGQVLPSLNKAVLIREVVSKYTVLIGSIPCNVT